MSESEDVSATAPDWSREMPTRWWDPGRRLIRSIRDYQKAKERSGLAGFFGAKTAALRHYVWSVVTQCEIPLNGTLGGGLLLPHPQGIVVSPGARVGPNCMLFHQTTLGTVEGRTGSPTLGGHVDVGAGAKILGPVVIGDHARIGANAVVLCDVPPGATAVGIPARVLAPRAARKTVASAR